MFLVQEYIVHCSACIRHRALCSTVNVKVLENPGRRRRRRRRRMMAGHIVAPVQPLCAVWHQFSLYVQCGAVQIYVPPSHHHLSSPPSRAAMVWKGSHDGSNARFIPCTAPTTTIPPSSQPGGPAELCQRAASRPGPGAALGHTHRTFWSRRLTSLGHSSSYTPAQGTTAGHL